jgi:hypothetical protein
MLLRLSRKERAESGEFVTVQRLEGRRVETGCPHVNHCPLHIPRCAEELPDTTWFGEHAVRCHVRAGKRAP